MSAEAPRTVPEFRPSRVGPKRVVTAIGKSGSGKSQVIYEILQRVKPDIALVFAGTLGAFNLASQSVAQALIIPGYDEATLRNLNRMMQLSHRYPELNLPKFAEVCLDDLGTSGVLRVKKSYLQQFFTEARHYGIGLKICIHSYSQLLPEARDSFHTTLLYKCGNHKQLRDLHTNFSTVDFKTFQQYMETVTGDYRALVINNLPDAKKNEELSWYKSDLSQAMHPIGRDDVREFCRIFCKADVGWTVNAAAAVKQSVVLETGSDSARYSECD